MRMKTMRGKAIDFARYISEQGDQRALGNAPLNARGDVLDAKGNIVRTRADITAEYHRKHAKTVKQVSIKGMETVFQAPADVAPTGGKLPSREADDKAAPRARKIADDE